MWCRDTAKRYSLNGSTRAVLHIFVSFNVSLSISLAFSLLVLQWGKGRCAKRRRLPFACSLSLFYFTLHLFVRWPRKTFFLPQLAEPSRTPLRTRARRGDKWRKTAKVTLAQAAAPSPHARPSLLSLFSLSRLLVLQVLGCLAGLQCACQRNLVCSVPDCPYGNPRLFCAWPTVPTTLPDVDSLSHQRSR